MTDTPPRVLRIHWPQYLSVPPEAEVMLLGQQRSRQGAVQETLVTGTAMPATATQSDGRVVGKALGPRYPAPPYQSTSNELQFLMQPAMGVPGGMLPIPLPSAAASSDHPCTRQVAQQQQQQGWEFAQVILYDVVPPSQQPSAGGGNRAEPAAPRQLGSHSRVQLAAHLLLPRMCTILLALALLTHRQGLAAAVGSGGDRLAGFVVGQMIWFMSAEPAGIKLHRQVSELLGVCGLRYTAVVHRLAAGWAPAYCSCATSLLAVALVGGGLRHGLLALQCLLWVACLPAVLPYAAMAAVYRWQLRTTALMWRAMRGKQRLPLLRLQIFRLLRDGGSSSSSGAGAANGPLDEANSLFGNGGTGGTGLKQLSGSMLLFMPLLLLVPTTAWFYAFAFSLHAAGSLPSAVAQLAMQLVQHNPVLAAAQHLMAPTQASANSSTGSLQYQYQLFQPHFDAATLPAAAQQGVHCTTYLLAQRQQGSCWHAAKQAAAEAWAACRFTPPYRICCAVLEGRPLWLASPLNWRSHSIGRHNRL